MTERARAHSLVAALSVVTQGTIRNYQPERSSGTGPLYPPSGFDRTGEDDREPGYFMRSHRHFVVRLKGCKTENDFQAVADDAQKALDAWKKTPAPPADSIPWKEKVAQDVRRLGVRKAAREWNISPKYAFQLRERYKDVA